MSRRGLRHCSCKSLLLRKIKNPSSSDGIDGMLHINLFSFLTSKGLPWSLSILAHIQLHEAATEEDKTDKKDALVIAQFLLTKKDSLFQNVLSWQCRHERPGTAEGKPDRPDDGIKSDTKRLLTITFPELEHIAGIFTSPCFVCSATILCEGYSQGKAIQDSKHPDTGSYGKQTEETVDAIIKAAATSIGTLVLQKRCLSSKKHQSWTVGRSSAGDYWYADRAMPSADEGQYWYPDSIRESERSLPQTSWLNWRRSRVSPVIDKSLPWQDWSLGIPIGQYVGLSKISKRETDISEGSSGLWPSRSSSLKDISAATSREGLKMADLQKGVLAMP